MSKYISIDKMYELLGLCAHNTIIWSSDDKIPSCKELGINGWSNFFLDKITSKLYTYRIKNYKQIK